MTRGEALEVRVSTDSLGLRLLSGRVDAGNMTEPDGIEDRGGDRGGDAALVTASLEDPDGPGDRFRGGGEEGMLSGSSDGVNSVDEVLAQSEKTLGQSGHCVSGLEHQV